MFRGIVPEVEIRYEEFGAKVIESIEHFLGLNTLIRIAMPLLKTSLDYRAPLKRLKNYLYLKVGLGQVDYRLHV